MKEIGVGIRIDANGGLSSTGIEEVNGLINRGGIVVSIEQSGALVRRLGEDGENVSWALSGCEMKVVVDDSGVETSAESIEHDRLHQEGWELISPYMQLVNRNSKSADSPAAHSELNRGIELLGQAIAINPANWSAHWGIGKAHQSLGNTEDACKAFGKSYGLQEGHADVAREYMFECLKLGWADKAVAAARQAVTVKPDDSGLLANLSLSLMLGGELDEATVAINESLEISPEDEISLNLKQRIADIKAGRKPQPTNLADLDAT